MDSNELDLNDLNDVKDVGSRQLRGVSQSVREAELKNTFRLLLFVGLLTIAMNAYQLFNSHAEVAQLGLRPIDAGVTLFLVRVIYGITVMLGVFFVIAGLWVKKYPVPLTILSLVLYVGSIAVYGMLDPSSLVKGIGLKIIVSLSLANAVKTALAYQKAKGIIQSLNRVESFDDSEES